MSNISTYAVARGGGYVRANIPHRCDRVWACLAGYVDPPSAVVEAGGWWRNIDLQVETRRSSSDVKMRQLMDLNPDLIQIDRRRNYHLYRINPSAIEVDRQESKE